MTLVIHLDQYGQSSSYLLILQATRLGKRTKKEKGTQLLEGSSQKTKT
jgi:hypothetical protein